MDKKDREELEAGIAKAFIETSRRERFLEVARTRRAGPKRNMTPKELKHRSKYSTMMANLEHWFEPRCNEFAITAHDQHSEARSKLSKLGASNEWYVMSDDHGIDGQWMSLEDALSHLAENTVYGTLIVGRGTDVAYYEQSELAKMTRILLPVGRSR
jgi:hypothetical protein